MHSVEYVYDDENGGVVTKYDFGEDGAIGMFYDSLNRVNKKYVRRAESNTAQDWEVFYTYKPGSETNQTTSLVSQIQYKIGTSGSEYYTLNYEYDNLGNITKITDGSGNTVARYVYDNLNQLVLEEIHPVNGTHYTMVYEYDTFGNIRKEYKYADGGYSSPGEAHSLGNLVYTNIYGYTDSSWADLLTSYNGTAFTYDASGNPTKYYNGRSYTLTWENGRQLANAIPTDTFVHFEYNADVIRTEKRVSKAYNMYYRLDGDTIIEMKKVANDGSGTTERYVMAYDENGNPFSISYYSSLTDSTPDTYY